MSEEEAYEFVRGTLREERIVPFHDDELEVVKSIENCINCGLCINHCPVVASVGLDRFSGPRSIAVQLTRSPPEYWATADKVYLCTGCGTCREVCPKNVNIPEIVNIVRARIFKTRRDLVPKGLFGVHETLTEYQTAFEPWEDPEEKEASRDMRIERLGLRYMPDRIRENAEVLFYPGCQAEERAQEVREAGKMLLEHFGVDYTLLEDFNCCGLPARLMGDDETARALAADLKRKVKELGVQEVVTTCAGCTSSLNDIASRDEWGVPVYHMVEYLVHRIGLERVRSAVKDAETGALKVTVHDPCHLIRHTSRQTMQDALDLLHAIPGVEVIPSGVADSCCGGGGLVAYHAKDVASAVTEENVDGITAMDPERVVTPCPLCTAQIESSLFRAGSSVEVDDLSVFIAQRLKEE
ncbi:(Fe-S)-binding protein [Candidatus Thorarchaeota archaeon]|nr:MAG: (Fe-S)-binding protein [Candidatus Thorarchaeota archaeon]